MRHQYTAYVQFNPETRLYVGTIPSLPGAHSQGATLGELQPIPVRSSMREPQGRASA